MTTSQLAGIAALILLAALGIVLWAMLIERVTR